MANIAQQFRQQHAGAPVSRRGRNFIEVETSPGTWATEIHMKPIHYGAGADQEIETGWVASIAPWDYEMTTADYNVHALSNFNSGQIMRWTDPTSGENITFQPQQLQWTNDLDQIEAIADVGDVEATVTDDVLTWTDAYGSGRDFTWQTSTNLLAKTLTLDAAPPAPPQFIIDGGNPVLRLQFIIQMSSGVEAWIDGVEWNRRDETTTSATVEFKDSGGTVLWRFKPATALDASADNSTDVLTRFRKQGPNLFVEVRVPWAWLETVSYPVEIDPTLDLQPDATDGIDAMIWAGGAGFNYGVNAFLACGESAGIFRALLQFDLSSLPGGAVVSAATLTCDLTSEVNTTNRDIGVHRGLVQWYEGDANGAAPSGDGSTWNHRNHNGTVTWTGGAGGASGTEWTASATDTQTAVTPGVDIVWDVQADVAAWATGTNNYGWWFINVSEGTAATRKNPASSDDATAADRPKLSITYTVPSGAQTLTLTGAG